MLDQWELELQGLRFKVEIHHDLGMGPPWEEHDGHGEVSEWTSRGKKPGERVLAEDRRSFRYYNWAGAVAKAKAEGWGPKEGGKTLRQNAATAVERDFQYLKSWCDDEWGWAWIKVQLLDTEGNPVEKAGAWETLGGMESNDTEGLKREAKELAEEIAGRFEGIDVVEVRIREEKPNGPER